MPQIDRMIELGTLGLYLVVLLGIGLRAARQVRTSVDYTLAGRNIPWVVVMATTAATMIGGGASVGMVSRVYEVGIAAALVTCAWHLQLIFTGIWVAPRLRGLNLVTVGDYFEIRFGSLARELAVVNCIIFLVGALTAQMAAIGTITSAVFEEIPYELALFIGAAVTIFYSTVGGIRAVIKTDVLQFVILVVGIGVAAGMLLSRNGGFEGMLASVGREQFTVNSSWSMTHVVSLFFAYLLGEMFIPPYTVRCFVAKDSRHARLGVACGGLFLLLFLPIATFVLGTSVLIDPEVAAAVKDHPQNAFPTLVRMTFHPALAGIMIAAIVAAVMSSADSCLSCLATVVMEDNYRRRIYPQADDRQLLRVARTTTLLAGIGSVVCAYFFRDIAKILEFIYDFWAPTMVVPFLVGIFWYKPSRVYAVVASMAAGFISTILWRFALGSPWELGPAIVGFLVSAVTLFAFIPLSKDWPLGGMFLPRTLPRLSTDESS